MLTAKLQNLKKRIEETSIRNDSLIQEFFKSAKDGEAKKCDVVRNNVHDGIDNLLDLVIELQTMQRQFEQEFLRKLRGED